MTGASTVTRATYGADVLGVTVGETKRLDQLALSAAGPSSESSAFARLFLTSGLPSMEPALAPLFT